MFIGTPCITPIQFLNSFKLWKNELTAKQVKVIVKITLFSEKNDGKQ